MRNQVKRLLWMCWYRLWGMAAISIILIALVFSALRLLIPLVPSYKQDIEQFASEALQRQISIEQISTDWKWFRPRIKLDGVELRNVENEIFLNVEKVILGLNIFESIISGQPQIDDISLLGTELNIERDDQGGVYLQDTIVFAGVQESSQQERKLSVPPVLFGKTLRLFDVDIHYSDELLGLSHHLHSVNMSLRLQPEAINAYLDVGLPSEYGQRFELGIELDGALDKPLDLQGRIFLRGLELNIGALTERLGYDDAVLGGLGSFGVWVDVLGQRNYGVLTQVQVDNPVFNMRDSQEIEPWTANRIELTALMQSDSEQIKASLQNFAIQQDDDISPEVSKDAVGESLSVNFVTQRDKSKRHKQSSLSVSALHIDKLLPLLLRLPDVADAMKKYQLNDLDGTINQLFADWDITGEQQQWQLSADFNELGWSGQGKLPSLQGLRGQLNLEGAHAELQLDTAAAVFDYPRYFREPLPAISLEGSLLAERQEQGLTVSARGLKVATEHAESRQWFDLRLQPGESPWLDAFAFCSASDAAATPLYLPAAIIAPKTLEWLDQAFVSGVAKNGEFEFRGAVNKYPFRDGDGVFRIEFDAVDNELDFWSPGPIAKNLRAHVKFEGPSLSVFVHESKILNSAVHDVEVQIDDLRESRLNIHGYSYGSAEDALEYVKQSQLRKTFEPVIGQVSMEGEQFLELDLSLKIRTEQQPSRFTIKGDMYQGSVVFSDWGIFLTQLNPSFHITERSVSIDKISALFNEQPVSLSASTTQEGRLNVMTTHMEGELEAGRLADDWNFPIAPYLKGRSPMQADLRLALNASAANDFNPQLYVQGDLAGTLIDVPYPLNKPATKKAPFTINSYFKKLETDIYFNYSDHLQSALRLTPDDLSRYSLTRADFRFNLNMPKMPQADGIWVSGIVPSMDLDRWQALPFVSKGSGDFSERLVEVDLNVKQLVYLRRTLDNLRLRLKQQGANWRFLLDSKHLQGQILMPKRGYTTRGLALALDYVDLDTINQEFSDEVPMPSELPPFQLTAKKMLLNEWDLRDVSVLAEPSGERLSIHSLRVQDPSVGLQGSGSWHVDRRGRHHTAFDLKFNSKDVGLGMSRFGFEEMIRGGRGQLNLNVEWGAAPSGFDFQLLHGQADVALKKGQILSIDPGGGRVLGLLSLQTIPRRLAMDFNDLFGKGYRFDKMNGNFEFVKGNAYTEDYYIDGPTGRIDITGRIGLVQQDYDQRVLFRPDLSSSLPILGALLGGSTGGWAVVVADRIARLFGKEADDLAQIRYTLTGSWDDPVITPVKKKAETKQQKKATNP